MPSRRTYLAVVLVLLFTSCVARADTLMHAPFDTDLAPTGKGFKLVGSPKAQIVKKRIGRRNHQLAARLAKGASQVVYQGPIGKLPPRGALSVRVGSVDVVGHAPTTVNVLSMKRGRDTVRIFKARDGHLYAVADGPTVGTRAWRYPIYDLQPTYMVRGKATWDIRHFITFQWGSDAGLTINGVSAKPLDGAVTVPTPTPDMKDGQLVLGDPEAR